MKSFFRMEMQTLYRHEIGKPQGLQWSFVHAKGFNIRKHQDR